MLDTTVCDQRRNATKTEQLRGCPLDTHRECRGFRRKNRLLHY